MSGRRQSSGRRPSHSSSHRRHHSSTRRIYSNRVTVPVPVPVACGAPARSSKYRRNGPQPHHPQSKVGLPNPAPNTYLARDLAIALRTNATQTTTTINNLSAAALQLLSAPLPTANDLTTTADIQVFLETWVEILDDIFFFENLIRQGLDGGFSLYRKEGSRKQGFCDKDKKNIRINTWNARGDGSRYAEQMVCTLFHTMLTAFLEIYVCECASCAWNDGARNGGLGIGGHGAPWCNAMVALQQGFRGLVGWRVDCQVKESLQMEMEVSGWEPTDDQLARWGVGALGARAAPRPYRHSSAPPRHIHVPDKGDDEGNYRITGVKQQAQTNCCTIM